MMIVAIAHTTSRHTTSTTTTGTINAVRLLDVMVTVGMVEGCDVMIIAVLEILVAMVTMPLLSIVNFGVGTTVCM